MIEGNQTKCVGIADEEGKHIVDVAFDTPLFAIWSPEKKNAPFICIEPWYGRCDAIDFEGDLSQREFTQTLEGGKTFEGGYTMKFYEYYW
jgi:galactose mutarotase-like enzyme